MSADSLVRHADYTTKWIVSGLPTIEIPASSVADQPPIDCFWRIAFLGCGYPARKIGEIMSVVQTAMLAKLAYTSLRETSFAHPTMAEGLTVLFAGVPVQAQMAIPA